MARSLVSLAVCALAATFSVASAAQADFKITEEFLRLCDDAADLDKMNAAFKAEGFVKASRDLRDVLSPDDMLTSVKKVKAWDITYDDGSGWWGVTARGKLGDKSVNYCAIMTIDEDLEVYRRDFDKAVGETTKLVASNETEKRFMLSLDGSAFIMRELRSPEISYFIYSKSKPIAAKEK